MKLSTKARHAITAMMDLAVNDRIRPVTLAEISKSQGISLSYLEQLFAKLRKDGLVVGVGQIIIAMVKPRLELGNHTHQRLSDWMNQLVKRAIHRATPNLHARQRSGSNQLVDAFGTHQIHPSILDCAARARALMERMMDAVGSMRDFS